MWRSATQAAAHAAATLCAGRLPAQRSAAASRGAARMEGSPEQSTGKSADHTTDRAAAQQAARWRLAPAAEAPGGRRWGARPTVQLGALSHGRQDRPPASARRREPQARAGGRGRAPPAESLLRQGTGGILSECMGDAGSIDRGRAPSRHAPRSWRRAGGVGAASLEVARRWAQAAARPRAKAAAGTPLRM